MRGADHCNTATVHCRGVVLLRHKTGPCSQQHTLHCSLSAVTCMMELTSSSMPASLGLASSPVMAVVCGGAASIQDTAVLRTLPPVLHCWCQPRPARRGCCAALRSCTELQLSLSRCHGAPSHRAHPHTQHVTRGPAAKYSGAGTGEMVSR